MRLNDLGMPVGRKRTDSERFVAVRPNGRASRLSWGSPYRAADWAMQAFGVGTWTELHRLGWTVQPTTWLRPADRDNDDV